MFEKRMNRNSKKGLSTIVSTLLILLLVFVAVAILWVVVRNVIQQGTEQVSLGKFTLDLKIDQVSVDESNNQVSVGIRRNQGEGEFVGIKIIVSDEENSEIFNQNGSLKVYEKKTFYFNLNELNVSTIKTIQIVPIFRLSSGKEVSGDVKDTWEKSISGFSSGEVEIELPSENETGQGCTSATEDVNCTTDYYSVNFCSGEDVYRNLFDFYCNASNKCSYNIVPELVQDCSLTDAVCSNAVCQVVQEENESEEIEETCFDGIQNQDETGIDCGGSCNSCESEEPPAIEEEFLFDEIDIFNYGDITYVNSESSLKSAVDSSQPGDAIVLRDGTYNNFDIVITRSGTSSNPIVVRAETPGGVILTGGTGTSPTFEIRGDYVIVGGFVFDKIERYYEVVKFVGAENSRVTQNVFFNTKLNYYKTDYVCASSATTCLDKNAQICGSTGNGNPDCDCDHKDARGNCQRPVLFTAQKIINFRYASKENRLDHNLIRCTWGASIGVEVRSYDLESKYNVIDHNYLNDLDPVKYLPNSRYEGSTSWNSGEPVQVGYGDTALSDESMYTTIAYNIFNNADSDPEIISLKSSENYIKYNTFEKTSVYVALRAGARDIIEGNYFLDGVFLTVNGNDHQITNNYFYGSGSSDGIQISSGDELVGTSGSGRNIVFDVLIAQNTFYKVDRAIYLGNNAGDPARYDIPPTDIDFVNNLFSVSGSGNTIVYDLASGDINWNKNVFWTEEGAGLGISLPSGNIQTNPNLQTSTVSGRSFKIPSSSGSASNAGASTSVSEDSSGNSRGSPPDIGANEIGATLNPKAPLTSGEFLPSWMNSYLTESCSWN